MQRSRYQKIQVLNIIFLILPYITSHLIEPTIAVNPYIAIVFCWQSCTFQHKNNNNLEKQRRRKRWKTCTVNFDQLWLYQVKWTLVNEDWYSEMTTKTVYCLIFICYERTPPSLAFSISKWKIKPIIIAGIF